MLASWTLTTAFVVFLGVQVVQCTLTDGFLSYITRQYGAPAATQMARKDLGINASFGGNIFSFPIRILRNPIILVHDLNSNASSLIPVRDFFIKRGYGFNEIYSTSYSSGKTSNSVVALNCSYVKQLRMLIESVNSYTGKNVVVAGYSLGAAIARKAILGGKCVDDTNTDLGNPLTSKINAFISVSGANRGVYSCESDPSIAACNNINGLSKNSAFVKDINSKQGYEGPRRYFLRDSTDTIVGYKQNNIEWSSFAGSQINVTFNGFNHVDSLFNTLWTQWSLIVNGFAADYAITKDTQAESKLTGKNCTGSAVGSKTSTYNAPWSGAKTVDQPNGGEYDAQNKIYTFRNGFWYAHNQLQSNLFGQKQG